MDSRRPYSCGICQVMRGITRPISHSGDGRMASFLCFDINSMSDFNKLNKQFVKFGRFLKQSKTPWLDTVNLLLGNKSDLTETEVNSTVKLAVPKSSAESFAKSVEASYFAVSAKSGQNLQPAMEDMIRRLRVAHQAKLNMSVNEVKTNQTNEAPGCLSCCSM
ncbi:hypothetical protein AHF37_08809 [Paragonimus kellicotti]|nr:hypothetical protein AHF37_08809 [Paragonimus kellicotti]